MDLSIDFIKAKNGETTCSFNKVFLHSSYNPQKEAERFAQTRQCSFDPINIIITEPCLSYCAHYLKEFFPKAKLYAIRYCYYFDSYNDKWDKVFYLENTSNHNNSKSLSEQLFNYFGEDGLMCSLFTSWTPSEKAFFNEYTNTWEEIKKALLKAQSVLATRSYFAKRWLKNTINFCSNVTNIAEIKKGSSPIIITASGPSLITSLPYLKKYRSCYFLISVSSSLSVLLDNEIIPDVCISTDGGYWAKLHFSHYLLKQKNIPLLLSPEGACYTDILQNYTFIPMSYGDGFTQSFLPLYNSWAKAKRNGTVSGTAAEYALSITTGSVYFCGLDLASTKGFAHSQPNELELFNSTKDNRLRPLQTRITPYSFNSPSLDIYRDWFMSQNFNGRLKRLSNNYTYKNNLNDIKDVNWNYFIDDIKQTKTIKPQILKVNQFNIDIHQRKQQINQIVKNNITNPDWIKELYPADYNIYRRSLTKETADQILNSIYEKINILKKELKIDI